MAQFPNDSTARTAVNPRPRPLQPPTLNREWTRINANKTKAWNGSKVGQASCLIMGKRGTADFTD